MCSNTSCISNHVMHLSDFLGGYLVVQWTVVTAKTKLCAIILIIIMRSKLQLNSYMLRRVMQKDARTQWKLLCLVCGLDLKDNPKDRRVLVSANDCSLCGKKFCVKSYLCINHSSSMKCTLSGARMCIN